ncbi:hypothetical protein BDF20DRAFT_845440 [Mycotypha africana]|uniref:uncharacterized protein n=1 Tax=Mycotypha africana TaxID=64632 RepID=UPI0023016985|nr:uncharacterized protein BDF20DRAFT_845440 [Mycotypha africana]KAI8991598.1 hypothetical protein BDF20DRAFT_845440 [Mycotypha africana]
MAFELVRFSGSTLEPSSEPIMLYEPHFYEKGAGRSLHIELVPTRPTPPLNRKDKPPPIIIPQFNAEDPLLCRNEDDYSAWSCHPQDDPLLLEKTGKNNVILDAPEEDDSSTTAGAGTSNHEMFWDTPTSITTLNQTS